MANAFFSKVHSTVAGYIGGEKADLALNRQLGRCNATDDNFASNHLNEVMEGLIGVCTLYLANGEEEKLAEVTEKLKSLV